ncbi:MAG TPA: helix-turn-helix domain-containing protein [Spirochaetia bacterium]|nr:helix-turn-helix domain-containing protein [Spirochaetia bacterium]
MRIARASTDQTGYLYARPFAGLPALTHCGEIHSIGESSVALHAHEGFEFAYLVSGTAWWQAGGSDFQQNPGELFFALPRQPHGTAHRAHPACHKLLLGLRVVDLHGGPVAARLLHSLFLQGRQVLRGAQQTESLIRGLILQVVARRAGGEDVCAGYLRAFLGLLTQAAATGVRPSSNADGRLCDAVRNALSFMSRELHRHVKLEEMAEASGLGVSQLCFHFRREVGMTPAAYHLQMRLGAAREALLVPHTSITHVAMEFGFSSSQHFAMDFRRTFGTTPLAWRRNGTDGSKGDGDGTSREPSVRGSYRDTRPDLPL